MAFITSDWIRESSVSTGTGDIVLAGARSPGATFSSVCANGDTFEYSISNSSQYETGIGTYNSGANSITRTVVFKSSNSDALVNLSSGPHNVDLTLTSKRLLSSGNVSPTSVNASGVITLDDGDFFNLITATGAITGFSFTNDRIGRTARIRFQTARTLTHNATSLIIPGGNNITTVAGDIATIISLGSGNFVIADYSKFDGSSITVRQPTLVTESSGGTLNDYALATNVDILQIGATTTITGIAGGSEGRELLVYNSAAAGSGVVVTLSQFSASSLAGNRFLMPNATTAIMNPGDGCLFRYFGSRWKSISLTRPTLANSLVANAALADMADATVKGRARGAGTGVPTDLTRLQVGEITRSGLAQVMDLAGGATHNNVAINDGVTHVYLNVTGTGDANITGFAYAGGGSGTTGARFRIIKNGSSNRIVLKHNTTSSSGNQIFCPGGGDWIIQFLNENIELCHDADPAGAFRVNSAFIQPGDLASTTTTITGTETLQAVTPDSLSALWEAGADNSGGATITMGEGGSFNLITSTTAITTFAFTTDKAGRKATIRFNTVRTLTHNATSLILPGGANITTAVGDICEIQSLGSGNFRVNQYTRASGYPLYGSPDPLLTVIEDDFLGVTIANPIPTWVETVSGVAANTRNVVVTNHPGVLTLVTGAISGNHKAVHLGANSAAAVSSPTTVQRFSWILRIPTITSITVRVGLQQSVTTASGGTAGAFFEFDPATSANWRFVTRQASTSTANNAVAVTAGNWYVLEAKRLSSGNWEFWVNGALQATNSANLPTTDCNFGACVAVTSAASRTLDLDYGSLISAGQRFT